MVPLARLMVVMVVVGVLLMPAEGTWHLPTVPPSIQVRKATLLFAQVSSHAAATPHEPLLTSTLCLLLLFVPLQ